MSARKSCRAAVVLALCCTLGTIGRAAADTLRVPEDFPTIAAALSAAGNGDTVIVADGVYTGADNKNLDFAGKAITLRSASGDPVTCSIDCEGAGRGFYFHSGEGAASIVQGLTIRNGNAASGVPGGPYGDGVYCDHASPTVSRCTITGGYYSAGVYCVTASPTLSDCTLSENSGGGVYCFSSTPTLTSCTIAGNTAALGGGLYLIAANATLTECLITDNSATDYNARGGGVYCVSSSPTLTDCTITGNAATGGFGCCGGLYCMPGSSPVVTYCDVQGNWAGTGNIDADPLLRDPDGPDNDPST